MSVKKSIRITDEAIAILKPILMASNDGLNYSGSINAMAEQFDILLSEATPNFSENEWNALYCCFNGYIPHPDIRTEASTLPWHLSEGYNYDSQVTEFLGSSDAAAGFVARLKALTLSQRIAVIYKANQFWRKGMAE